ncbi:oligosaccharide flippase family protein [Paenibacillus xerothermodurans]|uniref:Lipopolysaccharide biosynthesis protein n=1 Tax=Paenibacillus xerothermodurans TaxID=1977292 RepID=A0A2W1NRU3_PAEXE|nr:oligosaccharide flippase family protein [Paenibacillus xerothermodurans]PZE20476.1 lipopolysaccharide biosynthesis protein [Paenibacillus xerothermodurans]
MGLSLRRGISWTVLGNVLYSITQWITIAAIARLGSAGMVGQFTLGLAISAPIFIFSNLSLRLIQATDTERKYSFNDFLGLRLVSTAVAVLALVWIGKTGDFSASTFEIIFWVSIGKAVESVTDVYYGLFQQQERMDLISKSLIQKGLFSTLALIITMWVTKSLLVGVIAIAITRLILLALYDAKNGRVIYQLLNSLATRVKPTFRLKTLYQLVMLALPMGLTTLLISLNANIPRYFLEDHAGIQQLGFFGAISYYMIVNSTLINALGQSASARLSKSYRTDITAYENLLMKLLLIGGSLGVCVLLMVMFCGPVILTLSYGEEYAQYQDTFLHLMIASAISNLAAVFNYGIAAARYFKTQVPIYVLMVCLTILLSHQLIPQRGLDGAALVLMSVYGIQAALTGLVNLYAIYRRKMERSSADIGAT